MTIRLPLPPSINNTYKSARIGNRTIFYKSKQAKDWFNKAGSELLLQTNGRKFKDKMAGVMIYMYYRKRADIDNRIKPILDILTKCNIIEDDDIIQELGIKKYKIVSEEEYAVVTLYKFDHMVTKLPPLNFK